MIPLPTPIKSSNNLKRKPLRQVISFDKTESRGQILEYKNPSQNATDKNDSNWKSAPATCLNSPDSITVTPATTPNESTTTEQRTSLRHFFPDSVKAMDSPSQILTKLSECAREIFSSSNTIDAHSIVKDDNSDPCVNKISESDSEEIAGSIDGSTSCLELCFTEDESVHDDKTSLSILETKEKEYLNLQMKCNQIEIASKEKIQKLEKVILDLSK